MVYGTMGSKLELEERVRRRGVVQQDTNNTTNLELHSGDANRAYEDPRTHSQRDLWVKFKSRTHLSAVQ